MISDEGRRRAVAELRKASTGAYRHVDVLDVIANSIGVDIVGKFDYEAENETYAALADLIDRPTCNDVGDDWTFHCSACGCEIDIREMEVGRPTMWKDGAAQVPKYCPSCGAEVLDD